MNMTVFRSTILDSQTKTALYLHEQEKYNFRFQRFSLVELIVTNHPFQFPLYQAESLLAPAIKSNFYYNIEIKKSISIDGWRVLLLGLLVLGLRVLGFACIRFVSGVSRIRPCYDALTLTFSVQKGKSRSFQRYKTLSLLSFMNQKILPKPIYLYV